MTTPVGVLNRVFSPSPEELSWAQAVTAAADAAQKKGQAVFKVEGQMIDLPLIERAKQILKIGEPV